MIIFARSQSVARAQSVSRSFPLSKSLSTASNINQPSTDTEINRLPDFFTFQISIKGLLL